MHSGGLRAAAAARNRARTARSGRPDCGCCAGSTLPDARRFSDGIAPSAAESAVGGAGSPADLHGRSDGESRRTGGARERSATIRRAIARAAGAGAARASDPRPIAARSQSEAGRIRALGRPHGAMRGASRRPPARLHAAAAAIEDYLDLMAAIEDTAAHLENAGGNRRLHSAVRLPDQPISPSHPIPA